MCHSQICTDFWKCCEVLLNFILFKHPAYQDHLLNRLSFLHFVFLIIEDQLILDTWIYFWALCEPIMLYQGKNLFANRLIFKSLVFFYNYNNIIICNFFFLREHFFGNIFTYSSANEWWTQLRLQVLKGILKHFGEERTDLPNLTSQSNNSFICGSGTPGGAQGVISGSPLRNCSS